MFALLLAFLLTAPRALAPEGLPVAPLDLVAGRQDVPLRAPLVARSPGARLVLAVRGGDDGRRAAFEAALPPGSARAWLRADDGSVLEFAHTGYVYFRGYAGLVLSETHPGRGNVRYDALTIDSAQALDNVQVVWLDQRVRSVRDLPLPR